MKTEEFKEIMDEYSSEAYFLYAGREDDSGLEDWKNEEIARAYLQKYWLEEKEFSSVWHPIQLQMFSPSTKAFPDLLFQQPIHIFPRPSGFTLNPDTLVLVKLLMEKSGEDEFVVIQNSVEANQSDAAQSLRLKYPISVTWKEIMSGGYISTALFEMWHNDYFVFGKSRLWARYVVNDYKTPIDLFAVEESLVSAMEPHFRLTEAECIQITQIIPDSYKTTYNIHL